MTLVSFSPSLDSIGIGAGRSVCRAHLVKLGKKRSGVCLWDAQYRKAEHLEERRRRRPSVTASDQIAKFD